MAKHVFICGAGASREAGGPLMADFLDRAEGFGRRGLLDQESCRLVFEGINQLQYAQSKAVLDTENVEAVMAAFEMAALFGRLGPMPSADVEKLPAAITTVIAQTVEESIAFNSSGQTGEISVPQSHTSFLRLLIMLQERSQSVAIMTFNYDLILDLVVHIVGKAQGIDYGLYELGAAHAGIPLLKLHGSLGWTTSVTDGSIRCIPSHDIFRPQAPPGRHALKTRQILQRRKQLNEESGEPVIVPPTWAKTGYFKSIQMVWRRAAMELQDAENVYVLGYSLPETDQFFKLLYALGTTGSTRLKRFWVVNPDPHVEQRFEAVLGPAAKSRFRSIEQGFSDGTMVILGDLRDVETWV